MYFIRSRSFTNSAHIVPFVSEIFRIGQLLTPRCSKVELHKVKEDEEKPAPKTAPKAVAKKTKIHEEQHAANAEKPSK